MDLSHGHFALGAVCHVEQGLAKLLPDFLLKSIVKAYIEHFLRVVEVLLIPDVRPAQRALQRVGVDDAKLPEHDDTPC